MAALLPLSADEAYYWLWSKHLAAGYLDHPPAIAWLIRAGTMLFGDTRVGRARQRRAAVGLASWFVWRSGARSILKDEAPRRAGGAVVQSHLDDRGGDAGGDAGHAVHRHQRGFSFLPGAGCRRRGDGRWWLGAGVAGGPGPAVEIFRLCFWAPARCSGCWLARARAPVA